MKDLNENFIKTRQLQKGRSPEVFPNGNVTIAPVACSGILGRNIYRQLVNDGGMVLTNSASLLIFNDSKSYFRQSLQMARFHAVANSRTYIQASKGAPAFVIDSTGDYIVSPGSPETKFIDFSFRPQTKKTPYTILGEWVLASSLLFLSALLAYRILQKYFIH